MKTNCRFRSCTYIFPSMSAPANAKFQSLRGQNAGFPAKQPVKYSILCKRRCVGSLSEKVRDPPLTQFAPSELV